MSLKKLSLSLSLFAAFGLMACGDDSSSDSNFNENTVIKCDFSEPTETSYKMVAKGGDFYTEEKASYDGSSLKTINISILPDEAIEEMCSGEDNEVGMVKTSCDGNKMTQEITTALENEENAKGAFEASKNRAKKSCSDMDGKTVKEIQKSFDDEGDDEDDENGLIKGDDEGECDEECLRRLEEALEEQFGEGEVIEE